MILESSLLQQSMAIPVKSSRIMCALLMCSAYIVLCLFDFKNLHVKSAPKQNIEKRLVNSMFDVSIFRFRNSCMHMHVSTIAIHYLLLIFIFFRLVVTHILLLSLHLSLLIFWLKLKNT